MTSNTLYENQMTENELAEVYDWVDTFKLSKTKRNIARDFSDGLLVAEIIHQKHPYFVEPHNYYNSTNKKVKNQNWELLKKKVFKKLDFNVPRPLIDDIIEAVPYSIEFFLIKLKEVLQYKPVKKPKLHHVIYAYGNHLEADNVA